MNTTWQIAILDALESLDQKVSPQGLYGIRHAHAVGKRIPQLAYLLSLPEDSNILRGKGYRVAQTGFASAYLQFTTPAHEPVSVMVLDYATTKVRHFGSSFRVDKHHAKELKEPEWDLEKLIPKLSARSPTDSMSGILLVAHYRHEAELDELLSRSTNRDFLERYQISHCNRGWRDRFGRDFSTVIHLWTLANDGCHDRALSVVPVKDDSES